MAVGDTVAVATTAGAKATPGTTGVPRSREIEDMTRP